MKTWAVFLHYINQSDKQIYLSFILLRNWILQVFYHIFILYNYKLTCLPLFPQVSPKDAMVLFNITHRERKCFNKGFLINDHVTPLASSIYDTKPHWHHGKGFYFMAQYEGISKLYVIQHNNSHVLNFPIEVKHFTGNINELYTCCESSLIHCK